MTTRTKQTEALEFVAVLTQEMSGHSPGAIADLAERLMRAGRRLSRLAEHACNVGLTDAQERGKDRLRERLTRELALYGIGVRFQSDPRGATFAVTLSSGRYNSFGGADCGWCVPGA